MDRDEWHAFLKEAWRDALYPAFVLGALCFLAETAKLCFAHPFFAFDRAIIWPAAFGILGPMLGTVLVGSVAGAIVGQKRDAFLSKGFLGAELVYAWSLMVICASQTYTELAILGLAWQRRMAVLVGLGLPLMAIGGLHHFKVKPIYRALWLMILYLLPLHWASLPRFLFKCLLQRNWAVEHQIFDALKLGLLSMAVVAVLWWGLKRSMRWGCALMAGIWAALVIATTPPAMEKVPGLPKAQGDVIVVLLDALRMDYTSLSGDPARRDETPAMAVLGREGVVFETAYSPASSTQFSLPAMMGVDFIDPSVGYTRWTDDDARFRESLPGQLEMRGYRTALLSDFPEKVILGLDKLRWSHVVKPRQSFYAFQCFGNLWQKYGRKAPGVSLPLGDLGPARQLSALLSESDQPLFAFFHLSVPHWPHDIAPYRTKRPPEWDASEAWRFNERVRLRQLAPEEATSLKQAYRRAVWAADEQVEQIIGALRQAGRLENARIVLLGDHGESMMEHGEIGHGNLLYKETILPPLVLKGPGIQTGQRIGEPVTSRHLMKALLVWADGGDPIAVLKESLLRDEDGQAQILVDGLYGHLIVWGDWHMIWNRNEDDQGKPSASMSHPPFELYNLADDPGERVNLAAKEPALLQKLQRMMVEHPDLPERFREPLRKLIDRSQTVPDKP